MIFIPAVSLFAERLVLIQGSYLGTNRTQELSSETESSTFSEFGINITSFTGERSTGFFASTSFLLPTELILDSTDDSYDETTKLNTYSIRVGFDALLGIGYSTHINQSLSLLLGGGLHLNGIILFDNESYYSYVIGPGVSANLLFNLSDDVKFTIGASGAWDFIEMYHVTNLSSSGTYKNGYTFSISTGMGFNY